MAGTGPGGYRGHRGGPHHHDGQRQPGNHEHTDIVPQEKDEKKKDEKEDWGWDDVKKDWRERVRDYFDGYTPEEVKE